MIASRSVFDDFAVDYDRWFDDNTTIYRGQLHMLRAVVPAGGCGLEIGSGSGRFSAPLSIRCGIDPSLPLLRMARERGTEVVAGEGEHLPYRPRSFDYILMMTVICFLAEPAAVFREAFRVLVPGGTLVAGFIEAGGKIEERYRHEMTKGWFLQHARFRTPEEVRGFFSGAGFTGISMNNRLHGFCVMSGLREPCRL
jgi:ubiquinone/menaquinone biosynthesis C-methylase UbiE